jgi:hypothetical protein
MITSPTPAVGLERAAHHADALDGPGAGVVGDLEAGLGWITDAASSAGARRGLGAAPLGLAGVGSRGAARVGGGVDRLGRLGLLGTTTRRQRVLAGALDRR